MARMFAGRSAIGLVALCLVGAGVYVWLTSPGAAQSRAGHAVSPSERAVPVVATATRSGAVGVYLTGLGAVTPLNTVTVRSRVDGQLMRVLFEEGQLVAKDALLAEIDPRPFQVQLAQAEAQQAR